MFGGRASNSVDHIDDYGVEAGGPLWPDKAWLWGSYGKQQINKLIAGASDKTTLEDFAGKFNLQAIESNSFTLFFFRGDKKKFGRSAAADRPQPTTVDQKGPTTIWKGEDSQVFGPNFVASANYSWEDGGFSLTPEGGAGPSGPDVYQDGDGIWHNSFQNYASPSGPSTRPMRTSRPSSTRGSIGHELKFGFGWRKFNVGSHSAMAGTEQRRLLRRRQLRLRHRQADPRQDRQPGKPVLQRVRRRHDHGQQPDGQPRPPVRQPEVEEPAVERQPRIRPSRIILPAISYGGSGNDVDFKDWQPRVGLTYALGAQKTTLLRASYARYADQLGIGLHPVRKPDRVPVPLLLLERRQSQQPPRRRASSATSTASYGVNPNCTSCVASPNRIDKNMNNTTTDEFMIGVDHQILPEFVAGLTYTYRHRTNFIWSPYTQLSSANFIVAGPGFEGVDQHGNPVGHTGPHTATRSTARPAVCRMTSTAARR